MKPLQRGVFGHKLRWNRKERRGEMEKYLAKMKNEEGQGLVEYALIIALVSVALIGALGLLTGGIQGAFNAVIAVL
jgi:pilus assembly protein Flp/PilA